MQDSYSYLTSLIVGRFNPGEIMATRFYVKVMAGADALCCPCGPHGFFSTCCTAAEVARSIPQNASEGN